MKFKIRWSGYYWRLQYRWYDEGGGGWDTIHQAKFTFHMRLYARIWKFFYERRIDKLSVKIRFEL